MIPSSCQTCSVDLMINAAESENPEAHLCEKCYPEKIKRKPDPIWGKYHDG